MDNILNAKYEDLVGINDIGEIIAKSVFDWCREGKNIKVIEELKKHDLNMNYLGQKITIQEEFHNKTFVLTGTLNDYSRDEAGELISNRGGKVTISVTKKTDVVIVGENPGSKFDKAQELGITIWTEEEFKDKLRNM